MANIFKKSLEFSYMGAALGQAAKLLLQLREDADELKFSKNPSFDKDAASKHCFLRLCAIAYLMRKGVFDRMDEYGWSGEKGIKVYYIHSGRITVQEAIDANNKVIDDIGWELKKIHVISEIYEKRGSMYERVGLVPPDYIRSFL